MACILWAIEKVDYHMWDRGKQFDAQFGICLLMTFPFLIHSGTGITITNPY